VTVKIVVERSFPSCCQNDGNKSHGNQPKRSAFELPGEKETTEFEEIPENIQTIRIECGI